MEDYFEQVWNLDVSALFHDSEKTADRTSVRNAAAMLRERYKVLAMNYPDLLDSEEDSVSCSTIPGQPGCPALPTDFSKALEYYGSNTVPTGKITLVSNPIGIYGKEPVVIWQWFACH